MHLGNDSRNAYTYRFMKIRSFITPFILGTLLLGIAPAQAQRVAHRSKDVDVQNRFARNAKDTRATTKKQSEVHLYHGIVGTVSAVYFSGDVIHPGDLSKGASFFDNVGASLTVNYKLTLNPYVSLRFGLQYAYLQGSNRKALENFGYIHEFKSHMFEPYVGAECYPILNYGFFIYAGFGVANSCFINYEHQRTNEPNPLPIYTIANTSDPKYIVLNDKVGVVPMFQLGIGYNWWLDQNWTLGIELLGQIGVMDRKLTADGINNTIDGWPYKGAYSEYSENQMKADRKATDPDGWVQLGFVISYHFN